MRDSTVKTAVLATLSVGIIAIVLSGIFFPSSRGSFSVEAQRRWMVKAVQELSKVAPPSFESKPSTNAWENTWLGHPEYLLFSNDWAAYRINTIHDIPEIGDITVLRSSDGRFYSSRMHYCVGIGEWMDPEPMSDRQSPAPSDLTDFLEHVGRLQHWTLFAPKDLPWCIINYDPLGERQKAKRSLWHWISDGNGTNRETLLDRRYKFPGVVSWSTRWASRERLSVDVYEYQGDKLRGGRYSAPRSNYISTLDFNLDKRTGQFTDQK
jgi:hypothetical protein